MQVRLDNFIKNPGIYWCSSQWSPSVVHHPL